MSTALESLAKLQRGSSATTRSSRKENATIGTILKENGYATSWFGKDHNTPFYQATSSFTISKLSITTRCCS